MLWRREKPHVAIKLLKIALNIALKNIKQYLILNCMNPVGIMDHQFSFRPGFVEFCSDIFSSDLVLFDLVFRWGLLAKQIYIFRVFWEQESDFPIRASTIHFALFILLFKTHNQCFTWNHFFVQGSVSESPWWTPEELQPENIDYFGIKANVVFTVFE